MGQPISKLHWPISRMHPCISMKIPCGFRSALAKRLFSRYCHIEDLAFRHSGAGRNPAATAILRCSELDCFCASACAVRRAAIQGRMRRNGKTIPSAQPHSYEIPHPIPPFHPMVRMTASLHWLPLNRLCYHSRGPEQLPARDLRVPPKAELCSVNSTPRPCGRGGTRVYNRAFGLEGACGSP